MPSLLNNSMTNLRSYRSLLLNTTASERLQTLFNVLAIGMQFSDIYETNLGALLTDTSDEALAEQAKQQTAVAPLA